MSIKCSSQTLTNFCPTRLLILPKLMVLNSDVAFEIKQISGFPSVVISKRYKTHGGVSLIDSPKNEKLENIIDKLTSFI